MTNLWGKDLIPVMCAVKSLTAGWPAGNTLKVISWTRSYGATTAEPRQRCSPAVLSPQELLLSGYPGSSAHAGSRTRVTSMGDLYDAATLRALLISLRGDVKTPRTVLARARSTAASRTVPHARGPGSMPGRAPRVPQLFAWRLRRLWSLGRGAALLC